MKIAVGTALVVAIALAGCSSGETLQEASQEYCTALNALNAEVEGMRDLIDSDATVAELEEQRQQIRAAQEALEEQKADVVAAIGDQSDDLRTNFEDAVDQIPADATVSEAVDRYRGAAQEYLDQLKGLYSEAGC